MTYREIAALLSEDGDIFGDMRIEAIMDTVEEETGIYPDWDEIPPDWLLAENGISKRKLEKAEQSA